MSDSLFGRKTNTKELRRSPRVRIKPLHKIFVEIKNTGITLKIVNISIGGVGLLKYDNLDSSQGTIDAILHIEKNKIDVQFDIVNTDVILGCKFKNPSAELNKVIENYFMTELLALKFHRIESKETDEPTKGKTIFFHGQNNCELLIHEKDGNILTFSVILFGNYLEYDAKGGLVFGEQIRQEEIVHHKGVKLFRPLDKLNGHIVENAVRLIEGIPDLAVGRKSVMVNILKESLENSQKKWDEKVGS